MELMYCMEEGVTVGPILYADENLTPLALAEAGQLRPMLSLYDDDRTPDQSQQNPTCGPHTKNGFEIMEGNRQQTAWVGLPLCGGFSCYL
jgi:hypothetical protein